MKPSKINIKGKPLIIAGAAVVVVVAAIVALAIYTFSYGKIFPNISISGVKASGMTAEQIVLELDEQTTQVYDQVSFNVVVGENTANVTADKLMAKRDSAKASQQAMDIGRTGSPFKRMWDVLTCLFTSHELEQETVFDEEAMAKFMEEVKQQNNIAPKDAAYNIDGDTMTVTPAVNGVKVDEEALRTLIKENFDNQEYADITVETIVDEAKKLDMDEVYQAVHTQVQDAKMTEENGEHKITPHVVGIDFDLNAAKEKLGQNPDKTFDVALTVTNPKVTTIMLQSTLFKDVLSSVTTYYSPKKVARTHNVGLAAKYLNGTVLNPGETFSYNDTVGPRTAARGFKAAAIFASGEVVDGLGGGICQVSSTLYMAAMKADMKTVSRKNHSFYVDYAPKGQDATVVYGSIDFKFQNTSPYPIKIEAYRKNNYITVTIKGTKTQTKTVKITSKTLATKPFTEKVIEDSSLKPGERVIEQKGQEGITMDVYRSVYDANGKLITSYLENKTKYVPMQQIVRVGPSSASASAPAPSVTETPVPETTTTEQTQQQTSTEQNQATQAPEQAPAEETPAPEAAEQQPETESADVNQEATQSDAEVETEEATEEQ